ncbi:MAG: hypothetical protein LBD97_01485 [Bifidobacteriaceae bacterium]|jgi:hypothetical protein|nr:hypothetical protein [Bifidobacteriaceae bacterium]
MASITEAQARQVRVLRKVWYRAWPTKRDYSFTFEFEGGGWRVYVNNPPPVNGFIHLLAGGGGRQFICYNPPGAASHATPVPTLSEAQAVAAMWADCVENFRDSRQFAPAPGRPQVVDRSVLNGFRAYPSL